MPQNRQQQLQTLFPLEPAWRWRQIERALFDARVNGWQDISNLPQAMRVALTENMAWSSIVEAKIYASKDGSTRKALVSLPDGQRIETVLMKNKRGEWSVCVSSQVGCSMNCSFCATGRLGLTRNLTCDEIADQLRFWYYFLRDEKLDGRISNIVMMGMGEPLANYENVKEALRQWLACTDIGSNHITVSTVGLLPFLQRILQDATWPPVRLAISLHSADESLRKKIVPTTSGNYLVELSSWVKKYLQTKGSNKRHLTFEYVLLRGINDSPRDAKLLADFVTTTGRVKVNLIPFNDINDAALKRSDNADAFAAILKKCGVTVTVRQSTGLDIIAACGQLANSQAQ
jgi:23S rRNA (adenine2503-C2)-methyltransferase